MHMRGPHTEQACQVASQLLVSLCWERARRSRGTVPSNLSAGIPTETHATRVHLIRCALVVAAGRAAYPL
jgi:hypothetical protein